MPDDDRRVLEKRLEKARALIGETSALERFRSWKTPEETYEGDDADDEID
jgi:hypothetical protein